MLLSRPRLRTKTGCLTCRRRRKKCTEERPRCGDCTRHRLECTWPLPLPSPSSPSSSPSPSSGRGASPPRRCTVVATPTLAAAARALAEEDLRRHFVVGFLPLLVRAEAHPGYRDVTLYAAADHHPWIRDIFHSLAALHLAQGKPTPQAVADRYYHSALQAYWSVVESGAARGTEDWLLSAAVFLYLYEQWRSGVASNILTHLEGAARILRLRRLARQSGAAASATSAAPAAAVVDRVDRVDRIATESFLYHIALVSVFYPDLDALASKFAWADIDEGLRCNPFPSSSDEANSPVLGLGPSIYRLAFEVTRLSRHAPLQKFDRLEAAHHRRALDRLKEACFFPFPSSSSGSPTVQLYVLVLDIYLHALLAPRDGAGDAYVRHLVQAALHVIRAAFVDRGAVPDADSAAATQTSSTDLGWPVVVLACAVESAADMQLLRASLLGLWRTSFCGYVRRIALVVDRVWSWRTAAGPDAAVRCGLGLLTHKDGLVGFLDSNAACLPT